MTCGLVGGACEDRIMLNRKYVWELVLVSYVIAGIVITGMTLILVGATWWGVI